MQLTEEQILIQQSAMRFAAEVLTAQNDAQSIFPADAIQQMGQLGFLGMLVPEQYDGACSTIMTA